MAPPKEPTLMPIPGLDDPEPGKFAFTRTLDDLFARGWPYLRVLTDEEVTPAQANVAKLWLETHREWIEADALPVLDGWPHARAVAENVRAVLRGEALPPPPKPAELRKQLKKLFADLPKQMKACNGDLQAERATMRSAFETYCEINAALGEISPDAYFTHQLDLKWGAPSEDVHRWIDTAVDVAMP